MGGWALLHQHLRPIDLSPKSLYTVVQIIYPPDNCSYCVCELENFWVFAKIP